MIDSPHELDSAEEASPSLSGAERSSAPSQAWAYAFRMSLRLLVCTAAFGATYQFCAMLVFRHLQEWNGRVAVAIVLPAVAVTTMTFEAFRLRDASKGTVRFSRCWMLGALLMLGATIVAVLVSRGVLPLTNYEDPLQEYRIALGIALAGAIFVFGSWRLERGFAGR